MKIRKATIEELPNDIWREGSKGSFATRFRSSKYKADNIPNVMEIPIYVKYRLSDGEVSVDTTSIYLNSSRPDDKSICLGRFVIEVPLSAFTYDEALQEMVACFREEKRTIQAETQRQLDEIDGKIEKLLAIEYKPNEV